MSPKIVDRPHGTADYLLMCFNDPVRLWHQEEIIEAPAGTVIVWEPWQKHWFGSTTSDWSHSWMWLSGPLIPELITELAFPVNKLLPAGAEQICMTYLTMIYNELLAHTPADQAIYEGLFSLMLRELTRLGTAAGQATQIPLELRRVHRYKVIRNRFSGGTGICPKEPV